MVKKFRFYKEEDNRWYVDLPNWKGSKEELEMVSGADVLLDILSGTNSEVNLNTSTNEILSHKLTLQESLPEAGAIYLWQIDEEAIMDVYLCPVLEFVFGLYPETIYFEKA